MIKIRQLVLNDFETFIKYRTKFYSMDCVDHNVEYFQHEENFNFLITENPYTKAFILEMDNKSIGYAQISFQYSTEVCGMVVWIEELFVDENYRNNKAGEVFFNYIFKNFKAKRYRLEITENNIKAKKLYNRLGFKDLNYKQMIKDI